MMFVAKKSGAVEKYDTRAGDLSKPVAALSVPGGGVVMDFELSNTHDKLLVAAGTKVLELFVC